MIKHHFCCIQLTPSHLCEDVSYFCPSDCSLLQSIYVHCMTLSPSPLFPSAFLLIWGVVHFYVNGAVIKRQNLSLWNDKTAMNPPFCLWICFILIDAPQSSKGGTTSCVNQIEPDNCLIHLQPMFVPAVRNSSPLAFLHLLRKTVNACKSIVSPRGFSPSLSLPLFWCTPQTTPYIKNPSYLIWAVALGISANSKGLEL